MKFAFASGSRPLDGYTVKRGIHRGGFGEVYYAVSDGGKEVALKLLHDNLDIELRGVTQCLNLKHPNLVSLFDVRQDQEGDHWIVMEYVSGRTLEQILAERQGTMPIAEVRDWLNGIAAAVDFLHDRGIVHRDLKPGNIYREGDLVKVGDVGLSKFISQSRHNAQTQSVGTVYYMAPEVAHGRYGAAVDIYSLGVILYELLTGDVPFNGETAAEIMMKHLTQQPDLKPVPERFRPLVARMLAKYPADRPKTAGHVAAEFAQLVGGAEPKPSQPQRSTRFPESAFVDAARLKDRPAAARSPVNSGGCCSLGSKSDRVWIYAAVAVLVAAFVLPRMPRPVMVGAVELALIGGMVYAVAAVGKRMFPAAASSVPVATPPPPPASRGKRYPQTARVQHAAARAARRPISYLLNPKTPRSIPLVRRVADVSTSMVLSAGLVLLFTAAVATFSSLLNGAGGTPDAGEVMLFAGAATLASWAILVPSKWWEGRPGDVGMRRLTLLLAGLAVGAGTYSLDQYLLADFSRADFGTGAIFTSLGRQPLVEGDGQPTHWACLVFFGGLFALRKWWMQVDSFRSRRFRLWPVVASILIAWGLSVVWTFPQIWGMTLAATIASVVQLAAVWLPPEDRPPLVREMFQA